MSESRRFDSHLCQDLPVTTTTQGRVRLVYGLSRSYRNLMTGQPLQNELCWRYNQNKAVFALCDGESSPFAGRLAAQFLGDRLTDWLWALPDDSQTPQDELKVRLAYQLNAWAQIAQEQVLNIPLPDTLTDSEREEQETLRRTQGSETMFICARIDFNPGQETQVLFAWAGDAFLRCYSADGTQIRFDPVRNPANRWSSVLGLRGSLSVARLRADDTIRRIISFSPDIGAIEENLAGYTPRRLQGLLQECFLNRQAGDQAVLDLQVLNQAVEGAEEPIDEVNFNDTLSAVRLHYLETSDHTGVFEWSFPPDGIYSIIEEQNADGTVRPVYAGAGAHWIVPSGQENSRYRVCVFSPDGKSCSGWVEPVLVEGPGLEDTAAEMQPVESPPIAAESEPFVEKPTETQGKEPEEEALFSDTTEADDFFTPSTDLRSLEDIGLPLWPNETPEPAPPEKEAQAARDVDWETWQPSYYGTPASPEPRGETESEIPGVDSSLPAPASAEITPPEPVEAELPVTHEPTEVALPVEPDLSPVQLPSLESALGWQVLPEEPIVDQTQAAEIPSLLPEVKTEIAVEPEAQAGWLNFRSSRGEQPGEYVLEWDALTQVRDYEIKKHFAGRDRVHTVRGTRDLVRGLEPGRHYFRIRPIYPGPRQEWDERNLVIIEAPEPVRQAPGNLRLEANPAGTFTLSWTSPPGAYIEEFWIYDVSQRNSVLLQKVPAEVTRCVIQPVNLETHCKYNIRAVNWSGAGPDSPSVVYDPPGAKPQPGTWERLAGLFRGPTTVQGAPVLPSAPVAPKTPPAAPEEKPAREEEVTCTNFNELCEQVTVYLKRRGIRMERIRLEQRMGDDEYRSVDSRRTTELISLNFSKGPDHRLFVFGTKGEIVTAMITFDKMRWVMKVRFSLTMPKN